VSSKDGRFRSWLYSTSKVGLLVKTVMETRRALYSAAVVLAQVQYTVPKKPSDGVGGRSRPNFFASSDVSRSQVRWATAATSRGLFTGGIGLAACPGSDRTGSGRGPVPVPVPQLASTIIELATTTFATQRVLIAAGVCHYWLHSGRRTPKSSAE